MTTPDGSERQQSETGAERLDDDLQVDDEQAEQVTGGWAGGGRGGDG
ncbi:MAG TPA: hypothetical protein VMD59_06870 [Acidimicrobiales bacterium]|nr:hypothetical protein [Acidimicrobiales bacterium]